METTRIKFYFPTIKDTKTLLLHHNFNHVQAPNQSSSLTRDKTSSSSTNPLMCVCAWSHPPLPLILLVCSLSPFLLSLIPWVKGKGRCRLGILLSTELLWLASLPFTNTFRRALPQPVFSGPDRARAGTASCRLARISAALQALFLAWT